jgi:hypothetical protein
MVKSLNDVDFQDNYKVLVPKTDVEKMFKDMKSENVDSVKEVIKDIEFFISKRVEVNSDIMNHCEKLKMEIDNLALQFPDINNRLNFQVSGEIIKAISELRKKKIEVDELKIAEKLNFFRDVASLKKELREYIKELKEKESKSDLLDSLI